MTLEEMLREFFKKEPTLTASMVSDPKFNMLQFITKDLATYLKREIGKMLDSMKEEINWSDSGDIVVRKRIAGRNETLNDIKEKLGIKMEVSEEEIEEVLEKLATKQMEAVIKAVDEKGLMKTGWEDIDTEGGHLDFSVIAQAIVKYLRER